MNDEIKEKIPFNVRDVLEDINSNILWNYITNLQQENETRQQDINNLTYQLAKMKEENEELKEVNGTLLRYVSELILYIDDYKSRCEKAIEFINEYCIDDEFYINLSNKEKAIIDLLNILQNGSDN